MINNFFISITTAGILLTSTCSQKQSETTTAATQDTVEEIVKEAAPEVVTEVQESPPSPLPTTTGIVSHKFMNKGCSTVILVAKEGSDTLVLIPRDKLAKDFDADGLDVMFNYRLLRIPSQAGCDKGMPAEITDLRKK